MQLPFIRQNLLDTDNFHTSNICPCHNVFLHIILYNHENEAQLHFTGDNFFCFLGTVFIGLLQSLWYFQDMILVPTSRPSFMGKSFLSQRITFTPRTTFLVAISLEWRAQHSCLFSECHTHYHYHHRLRESLSEWDLPSFWRGSVYSGSFHTFFSLSPSFSAFLYTVCDPYQLMLSKIHKEKKLAPSKVNGWANESTFPFYWLNLTQWAYLRF